MDKKWIIALVAVIAIALIGGYLAYQTFFLTGVMQAGGEAPLTGEIELEIVERDLTAGSEMKVVEGEHLKATWTAEWWNRSLTWCGGNNIAGTWFIDGEFLETMTGSVKSINQTWCYAENVTVPGCFGEYLWSWKTIPIIATLPAEGGTTSITKEITIDTTGLRKGTHQLVIKAYMINGASTTEIFNNGGACFPQQTASQGFPCAGIYGTTQQRSKTETPRCPKSIDPYWGTVYTCPSSNWNCGSCLSWCCQSTGDRSICPSGNLVFCDGPAYRNWSGWSEYSTTVEQTQEQVMTNVAVGGETVAVIEFEVVEKCTEECCVGEEGYTDKRCPQTNQVCSNNTCVTVKETCPRECCAGEEEYYDKDCTEGYACSPPDNGGEYTCKLQVIDCPFACCEGKPQYNDKACETGKYCENNECKIWTPLPQCGNTICETGETATTCPTDCDVQTQPECGNAICEENETETCPQDCQIPAPPTFPFIEIVIVLFILTIAGIAYWLVKP